MNLHAVRTEISELLARFVREIEVNVAMGAYDPNVVAETVLVPLLGEVLDLPGLVDLNTSVGENFPGVDLGDSDKRVAIQVTSDSSGSKVKETLETFFRHGLDAKFDRVILYVLTHRQGKYGGEGLANAVPDTFDFDPDRDVMDFRSVATAVKSFQYDRAYRVLEILRTNFEDGRVPLTPRDAEPKEPVYLNLIDVGIPDTLYVADFGSDRKEVRAALKEAGERIPRRGDERGLVQGAMTARGERFSADYHAHAGQILTFHDLSQDSPLSRVVDPGSIVALSPDEYYGASDDLERVFKTLLHHCLRLANKTSGRPPT